jgi:chromosome segregation ATPase
VNERRVYDQTFQVSGMTPDQIVVYTRNKTFNDAARQQLQRVVDQKNQIAANDRDLRDATTQISSLTSDEDRIRNNIQSLNNVSGQQQQVQNYARQLDAHEQQLATLRDRQSDLQKKKVTLAADLATMLEGLTF